MAAVYNPDHHVPCELVRKILIVVFADSMHTICRSESAPWEMDVAPTLSSVSFAFREIVKEVAIKTFEIPPLQEDQSVLSAIRDKLVYLRKLGRFSARDSPIERLWQSSEPTLIRAYAMWLTSIELRENTAQEPMVPSVFVNTHRTILHAFDLSRQLCTRIHPRGMTFPLMKALENDRALVQTGMDLVQARIDIYGALRRMDDMEDQTNEDKMYVKDSIKAAVHESLRKVEMAELFNVERISRFMLDFRYRTFQLPPLIAIIQRCGELNFDLDEYDIGRRVQSLLNSYESYEIMTQALSTGS